jgi:hypothetical protein
MIPNYKSTTAVITANPITKGIATILFDLPWFDTPDGDVVDVEDKGAKVVTTRQTGSGLAVPMT